MKTSSPR